MMGMTIARRTMLVAFMSVTLAGAALGAWVAVAERQHAGRVLPGVVLEGSAVGGLDAGALSERVHALAAPALSRPVTVRIGAAGRRLTASDLGLRVAVETTVAAAMSAGRSGHLPQRVSQRVRMLWRPAQIPIAYRVDGAAAQTAAIQLGMSVLAEPQNAVVELRQRRLVVTRPSQPGVVVDAPASAVRIMQTLEQGLPVAELVVEVRHPLLTTEVAEGMADPVAVFSTRFPYNPNRIHNIRLAAAALRGLLVPPGAVVSYNAVVGPRDAARGFRKAPVLVRDILIPGDGGGICQVSSTFFNTGLLAEMAVDARTNHSQPVAYLPAGRDATVDYGRIDLRLRNTTGQPLVFWTEVGSSTLTVMAFAPKQPGREVVIFTTDRTWIPAPTHTVTRHDPFLDEGNVKIDDPKPGQRLRTVRVIRQDGVEVQREVVATSVYRPVPRMIRIGTRAVARNPQVVRTASP